MGEIGILCTFRHQSFLRYNGQGNEGDGCHEGHEGNEEEEGWFQGGSAPRYVREDHRWLIHSRYQQSRNYIDVLNLQVFYFQLWLLRVFQILVVFAKLILKYLFQILR